MAKFQIYTYMFHPVMEMQGDMSQEEFESIDVNKKIEQKQELLGKILDKYADSGEQQEQFEFNGEVYSQRTYLHRDGIYVLRIANNKKTRVEQNFSVMELDNHPSSLAIIDNRHDRQIIAIERRNAFSEKTSKDSPCLADIIQTTFRKKLAAHRLSVDVKGKYHTAEFWQVVDGSMTLKGIDYVDFPFPYPNLPEISDMVGPYFTDWGRRTNSEPTLHLKGQNGESVKLSKDDLYILQAIRACAASGRPILIKPKGSHLRKIGLDSPVIEEVADVALKELDKRDLLESKYQIIVEFLNTIKLVYE